MAFSVWFTGLPGSGKTVIASQAAAILRNEILQLDEIRKVLTPDPKYTDDERDIVYASVAYMAKLLTESGVNVVYEEPINPIVIIDSDKMKPDTSAKIATEAIISFFGEQAHGA